MRGLEIIVCLKQVPDPEGPSSAFRIDSQAKKVISEGIPPVINPYDENALEAALKIKDSHGGRVTAISMGRKLAQPVLRKALAAGADELILLEDEHFENLDSYSTVYILSTAVKKIGQCDLILTGRQAADWDFGQTGVIIAEMLGIPAIILARKVKIENGKVIVEKLIRGGYEVIGASMPALVTVSSEIGDLRSTPIKAIIEARKKPLQRWGIADLEVDWRKLRSREICELVAPSTKRVCFFIEGQSSHEKGEKLAVKLKDDRII